MRLPSTIGDVALTELAAELLVLYVYPQTGAPGTPSRPGWDELPGARGCTAQSCGFRDHAAELAALRARVAGLSGQTPAEQQEFATRMKISLPIISDAAFVLERELSLPTFELDGAKFYKRLALVAKEGLIVKVFYPVFPPDQNAVEVIAWLAKSTGARRGR